MIGKMASAGEEHFQGEKSLCYGPNRGRWERFGCLRVKCFNASAFEIYTIAVSLSGALYDIVGLPLSLALLVCIENGSSCLASRSTSATDLLNIFSNSLSLYSISSANN